MPCNFNNTYAFLNIHTFRWHIVKKYRKNSFGNLNTFRMFSQWVVIDYQLPNEFRTLFGNWYCSKCWLKCRMLFTLKSISWWVKFSRIAAPITLSQQHLNVFSTNGAYWKWIVSNSWHTFSAVLCFWWPIVYITQLSIHFPSNLGQYFLKAQYNMPSE